MQSLKTFSVKCHTGAERDAVLQLTRKFINAEFSDSPINFVSASAPINQKGRIYIEALSEAQAREAIDGLRIIFPSSLRVIPFSQRKVILSVPKAARIPSVGSWVRIKKGNYRGDLAIVEKVNLQRQALMIRLVPRVDFSLRLTSKSRDRRVPQKLINWNDLDNNIHQFTRRRDSEGDLFIEYNGDRFSEDGFIFKAITLSMLIPNAKPPTPHEIAMFQISGHDLSLSSTIKSYDIGDKVQIISGPLKGMFGTVTSLDTDKVIIKPDFDAQIGELRLLHSQIQRVLAVGASVKIIGGPQVGVTGSISSIPREPGGNYEVLSDVGYYETYLVPGHFLIPHKSSSTSTSSSTSSSAATYDLQFKLYDLIQVSPTLIGCIYRIGVDTLQVLTTDHSVESVPIASNPTKISSRNTLPDSTRNIVRLGDDIRIIIGPNSGQFGPVKAIGKGHFFIQSSNVESGIIPVPSAHSLIRNNTSIQSSQQRTGGRFRVVKSGGRRSGHRPAHQRHKKQAKQTLYPHSGAMPVPGVVTVNGDISSGEMTPAAGGMTPLPTGASTPMDEYGATTPQTF